MPLIKSSWKKTRKQNLKPEFGTGKALLKMYKYFPNSEFNKVELGCCITMVLMDSGFIWIKRTKHGVAHGLPNRFRSREWKIESYTEESPEQVRYAWKAKGWILPKNYWVGPPELRPSILRKEKKQKKQEEYKEIKLSEIIIKEGLKEA